MPNSAGARFQRTGPVDGKMTYTATMNINELLAATTQPTTATTGPVVSHRFEGGLHYYDFNVSVVSVRPDDDSRPPTETGPHGHPYRSNVDGKVPAWTVQHTIVRTMRGETRALITNSVAMADHHYVTSDTERLTGGECGMLTETGTCGAPAGGRP